MSDLIRRMEATQKTMDRFQSRAFDWNGSTCIHLARFHLRQMGHKPPPLPQIRSALSARRAMDKAGYANVAAIFDGLMLPEITPAAMMLGDIGVVPGDDGFDAVVINAGGKMLGWREDVAGGIVPIADALSHVTRAFRL